MFKNLSSGKLLIIFVVLLALAAFFIYYDSSTEIRTFKSEIVAIDTSEVTAISIFPKATNHKELRLFKKGNSWQVNIDNNKSVPADESKIKSLIGQLSEIKANRVAAQDESKWSEYKVDTSGTRVKVFEGDENTLDITLGKYAFQQPRTMMSYVRVKGDENVYEVNGFLEFSFNQSPNHFRNSTILNDDVSNWTNLSFSYPADSSFQMVKDTTGYWLINNVKTDSVKTADFLRTLSHLSGNDFIDNALQDYSGSPEYRLNIESSKFGKITISGYQDSGQLVIRSSQNQDAYFNGNANSLWQKIFVGRNYFLKK